MREKSKFRSTDPTRSFEMLRSFKTTASRGGVLIYWIRAGIGIELGNYIENIQRVARYAASHEFQIFLVIYSGLQKLSPGDTASSMPQKYFYS